MELDHQLRVMECVQQNTQDQALIPWKYCMQTDHQLSKEELAILWCKTLNPTYRMVLDALTKCVDDSMTSFEVEAWIPIMQTCAHSTATEMTETASITSASSHTTYKGTQ
ncbi:uncharacterized protein LOC118198303 [Stegodyphus dumicola]|uniref:uncharacterized protein LOC118198303 n=1 Tax=Stegodyphus dumicola TaxID=202533 RepID=UPI0015B1E36B|nr:uncharacterized protein LOC118198303 [Stegodyphus dumicola]